MIKTKYISKRSLLGFALIILVCLLGQFLIGGVAGLARYRQSVLSDYPVTVETVSYFLKEYIQTRLNIIFTPPYKPGSKVPVIDLYASTDDFARLNSDLPNSGKSTYITGYMKAVDEAESTEVKLRYRGDLPFHWLYQKKSFRVKLPDFQTYHQDKVFNLIHPTTLHMISDWMSYSIAKKQGLLSPDYYPVRVRINSVDNGLHFYLSQPTETFLRKNRRMPGSIYVGDRATWRGTTFNTTFHRYFDADGVSFLWRDARLWKKVSARNAETQHDKEDLKKFIEVANQTDPNAFFRDFQVYFDSEKYFRYFAIDTLFGSEHHDYFHNHKFYFDPYKGKFEPIEWDVRFWSAHHIYKDLSFYPLLDKVKRNPLLEYQRDLVAYRMLQQYHPDRIIRRINELVNVMLEDIRTDPFKMFPIRHKLFPVEKNTPFTMDDYQRSVKILTDVYFSRYKTLQDIYADTSVVYTTEKLTDKRIMMYVSVSGNSPVVFDPFSMVTGANRSELKVSRVNSIGLTSPVTGHSDLIYPGRRRDDGNFTGKEDEQSIDAFGTFKLLPSPLIYTYRFDGVEGELSDNNSVRNAVTGQSVNFVFSSELPSDKQTVSMHPWLLDDPSYKPITEIVLQGEIHVNQDRVYESNQHVKIMPGTTFHLAASRSILFFGRVSAIGKPGKPIRFLRLSKAHAWGAIVIQGKAASNSVFRHIEVSGGSVVKYHLVDYPGQFNIHDVSSFTISDSRFQSNIKGDDSVHIAYSKGVVENSEFSSSFSDALDIDISTVDIVRSRFRDSGNDAIDMMNSTVRVDAGSFFNAGDKCFSIGERSKASLANIQLSDCATGIAVKDESEAKLDKIRFLNKGGIPIALYQKNPRYRLGGKISGSQVTGISIEDIKVGSRSEDNIVFQ